MINIIALLCGTWATGLGIRYSIELLASDGWIHIPRNAGYGINIWFDFVPLAILGLLLLAFEVKVAIKGIEES